VSDDGLVSLVGVPLYDTGGVGSAGVASLYRRLGDGSWAEAWRLAAPDRAAGDRLGAAVGAAGFRAVIVHEECAGRTGGDGTWGAGTSCDDDDFLGGKCRARDGCIRCPPDDATVVRPCRQTLSDDECDDGVHHEGLVCATEEAREACGGALG